MGDRTVRTKAVECSARIVWTDRSSEMELGKYSLKLDFQEAYGNFCIQRVKVRVGQGDGVAKL